MMQTHHWGSWVYEIADVTVDAAKGNATNITFGAGGFQVCDRTSEQKLKTIASAAIQVCNVLNKHTAHES
jgi:hypothetical protein